LFDSPEPDAGELRIPVIEQTDQACHVFLPDIGPGQLCCYRLYGAYEPACGLRFNHRHGTTTLFSALETATGLVKAGHYNAGDAGRSWIS
jgi:pullulanase/glycogen debranching enzyme